MPRIRTVKPSFWGDEKVSQLSRDARLLLLGLYSFADDEGRFLASHQAITGHVYPNDDDITPAKLKRWLAEIEHMGMVVLYNSGRIRYGAIPKFRDHQRISHPQGSTLPPPPSEEPFHEQPWNGSTDNRGTVPQIPVSGREGIGREGIGGEWKSG